jgi:hypothetical protein
MNIFLFGGCLAIAAVGAYATAKAANELPDDTPTTVNGYELACTGVGDEAKADPRWPAFPVRIEFANRDAQYLSDVDVTITDAKGEALFSVRCESPWFLAKIPPGKYTVAGTFDGQTETAKFTAPASGQSRIVVRFPQVAGDH